MRRETAAETAVPALAPRPLTPEALKACLEVINGHSEALVDVALQNTKLGLVTSTEHLNPKNRAPQSSNEALLAGPQACFAALSLSQSRPLPPMRPRPLLAGRCWLGWTLQATLRKTPLRPAWLL